MELSQNRRVKVNLTSHLSFKENKVLKKNTIQITGQMMRPSQKIRASASVVAMWFGETCWGTALYFCKLTLAFTCFTHFCSAFHRGSCVEHGLDTHKTPWKPVITSCSHIPGLISLPYHGVYLSGFKNPVTFPIFIYLVPPSKTHHESSGYILRKVDKRALSTLGTRCPQTVLLCSLKMHSLSSCLSVLSAGYWCVPAEQANVNK